MFNDTSSPLALLATRRSGKARDMVAPFPSADQLAAMIAIAARVPDHGKLSPWRFVVIPDGSRDALSTVITDAYLAERPNAGRLEIEAMDRFARYPAALVAVLHTPVLSSKIPLWEQQLSAGAVAMQLLNAAHAHGFVGNWLTGWAGESAAVAAALGADRPQDRIVGFFFIGSPASALEERPRPDLARTVHTWQGVA